MWKDGNDYRFSPSDLIRFADTRRNLPSGSAAYCTVSGSFTIRHTVAHTLARISGSQVFQLASPEFKILHRFEQLATLPWQIRVVPR